ncbi:MAG: DUF58 domain-containing protein [Thermodesulfobacteriota bacterium]
MHIPLTTRKDSALAAREHTRGKTDERVYVSLAHMVRLQHKATGYSFLPRQPIHSLLSGRYASRLRGRGLNFEELRQYQHGDDIRTMDWKVTARTRKPHVRVYTEERDRAVLLLVDQRTHMFFGSRERMKSLVAAEAAALGAWRALNTGDRVGAIIFNDESIEEIEPQRSKVTVMAILRAIERMNNALRADSTVQANSIQLNTVLQKAHRLAKHDTLVVLITDGQGADDNTTRLTAQLARHNDVLCMLLYDPLRESPQPSKGQYVVTDGRLQMALDFHDRKFLERIAADYRQEMDGIRTVLRKISAPLLPISTAKDVVDQIRKLIGTATRIPSR